MEKNKTKQYQKQLNKIVVGKGLTGKTTPKKGEHNQRAIDKKNTAMARKKLREAGKASEYKTKRIR